jgi:hypothetical protein
LAASSRPARLIEINSFAGLANSIVMVATSLVRMPVANTCLCRWLQDDVLRVIFLLRHAHPQILAIAIGVLNGETILAIEIATSLCGNVNLMSSSRKLPSIEINSLRAIGAALGLRNPLPAGAIAYAIITAGGFITLAGWAEHRFGFTSAPSTAISMKICTTSRSPAASWESAS